MNDKLRNLLNRDSRKALASMPKPVREELINELASLTEEIAGRIKRELPSILNEIVEKSYESEPDEVLKEFRERVSKIIESDANYYVTFRGSSGCMYQVERAGNNVVIRVFSKTSTISQLTIPSIDVKELVRRLSKFIE